MFSVVSFMEKKELEMASFIATTFIRRKPLCTVSFGIQYTTKINKEMIFVPLPSWV